MIAGALFLPWRLKAASSGPFFKFSRYAIIDMHCHPSLKMYLLNKKMWRRHHNRHPGDNLTHQQLDVHEMQYGNVRVMIAKHYLPEGGIEREWGLVRCLWPLLHFFASSFTDKFEHEDSTNIDQVKEMMALLECQLDIANRRQQEVEFVLVRTHKELQDALKGERKIPVIHAIEGAHALGRKFVRSERKLKEKKKIAEKNGIIVITEKDPQKQQEEVKIAEQTGASVLTEAKLRTRKILPHEDEMSLNNYLENLEELASLGVCMMTLSHFFCNDISYPVEGISPSGKKKVKMNWHYCEAENKGLTYIGKEVVSRMLDIGMLVDLTHTTPAVRQDVFKINNCRRGNMRPLVCSHTGAQTVFDRHDDGHYPEYKYYCLSAQEICEISKCGGVIGIVPEIFWLAGSNDKPMIANHPLLDYEVGIPYLIETIIELNKYTVKKDFSNIAIGTDFDGLATNPKDLYLNRQLSGLFSAMQADNQLNVGNRIELITFGNAHRVLLEGWGR